jgi:hypothetical protein
MTTAISNVQLEGARIVRVVEDADRQCLTFEVTFPIPDGGSDFPRRKFAFQWCSRYVVEEERGAGEPTIRRVEISKIDSHRATIRMHTDHGFREVTCWPDVLEETI